MADELNDAPDMAEFEDKLPAQTNNKDIWLFLIIVDVVFLCVFGFFLYKNLSARLLAPAEPAKPAAVAEITETDVEEVVLPEVSEPAVPVVSVTEKAPAAEPKEVVAEPEPVQPVAEIKEEPAVQPEEKKESVIIKVNPKSKYRKVTFRYFGEGKNVAVVSGFTMAKPRTLIKKDGYWETTLSISPGTYKFLYVVDGAQVQDPYSEQKDGRSLLVVK